MTENTVNKLAGAAVQTQRIAKTAIEFMVIGSYPISPVEKRGEKTIDMLCQLQIKDKTKPLILIAYGDKNIQHLIKLELFHAYTTNIEIDDESLRSDVVKVEIQENFTFKELTAPIWNNRTIEDRIKQVFAMYPFVPLINAERNLSKKEKDKYGKDKTFVDRTDVKVIELSINSISWGDEMILMDGFFQARISRMLLMKAQTGEGSKVKLLGTLESKDYKTEMYVCNILPIERKPLKEQMERGLPKISPM